MIRFRVPSIPVAQPRQRHRIMAIAGRQVVGNYTPRTAPVNAFKASVQLSARSAYTGPPLEGPLQLQLVFLMPRPGRLRWKKRDMPRCWHDRKPDADNLVKAVKDSLNGLLWRDDSQIALLSVAKLVASGEEQPGVEVEVSKLEAQTRDKS